jgi:hypothetical protein
MGVADEVQHGGLPGAWTLALGTVPDRISQHKRCRPAFFQSSSGVGRSRRHGGHDRPVINGGAVATGEGL